MRRFRILLCALAVSLSISAPAGMPAAAAEPGGLDMYSITTDAVTAASIVAKGFDVVDTEITADGTRLSLVLSPKERNELRRQGLRVTPVRDAKGRSSRERALEQAANGFNVWRSWDEPGGIRDELYKVAKENPQLVKLVVLGHTYQGREIIALKLTQGAGGIADGSRPAVLYSSTQHAREWISTEVNRRLMNWYIDEWRADNKEIKDLLKANELWFLRRGQPRRLPVHVRPRAAVAEEPARQRRRRPDHARRRRRPEPQLPRALGYDEEGSSSQTVERHVPRSVRRHPSPRRRR